MMDIIIGPRSNRNPALVAPADDFDRFTARSVLAHPNFYSVEMQRSACVWLLQHGDWLDYERARCVLAAILKEWDAKEQARVERKVWRATKWFAAIVLAVVLGIALGKAVEKAMGQYRYDAATTAERVVP